MVAMIGLSFLVPVHTPNIGVILLFAILGCMLMAALGLLCGLWADKFDHMAAVTNFIVTPLTFLSGTFYTIDRLPETFQSVAKFNPFFHMIDGFRFGFIDASDHPVWQSLLVLAGCTGLVLWACWALLASGYKIKS